MKTVRLGKKPLHIEAPGCIVNIEKLTDAAGRPVTRVDVNANGDRYAGEPAWWCADAGGILERRGIGIRIVKGINPPSTDNAFNALQHLFRQGHSPDSLRELIDEAWAQHNETAVWG